MYKEILLNYLIPYLETKKWDIRKGKVTSLVCPMCGGFPATLIPNSKPAKINCWKCNGQYNLLQIVQKLENKPNENPEELYYLIKEALGLNLRTEKDNHTIKQVLKQYKNLNFNLVAVSRNSKIPIEREWTSRNHLDLIEWEDWIFSKELNIGVMCGETSNLTVIDIDTANIPEEIDKLKGNCLIQKSNKGYHLFYKYEPDLPTTRIDSLKVDILNKGRQCIIYPSVIEDKQRKFITDINLIKMPLEFKNYLKSQITLPNLKSFSEQVKENIINETYKKILLKEGDGRNEFFIHMGGMLRKQLNQREVEYGLNLLNKTICEPPLPQLELTNIMKSLEHYNVFDEQELAHQVLEYIKLAGEVTKTDIEVAIMGERVRGDRKKKIDKVVRYLMKEGYIILSNREYKIIQKANWKTTLVDIGKPVSFKVPYFDNTAHFNWGDILLIASANKAGKSHIALNIAKQLIDQGIRPYYINLEPGNRFAKIAMHLGIREGDIYWDFISDPTTIELEPNSVTIIDWLLCQDFAKTDKVFFQLTEQLGKVGGFLIIFQQLKEDNTYFAPNLCVDEKTEILTKVGWKNHKDLTIGESVAGFDMEKETIEYCPLLNKTILDHKGIMYHIKNDYTDQLLTPYHNVPLKYKHNIGKKRLYWWDKKYQLIKAQDITPHRGIRFPVSGSYNGDLSIGKDFAKLLGIILAEGTVDKKRGNIIRISQSHKVNKKKCDIIENLLIKLKIKHSIYQDKKTGKNTYYLSKKNTDIYNKIFNWITFTKKPVSNLLHLKKIEQEYLLDGLLLGDGCQISENSFLFFQKDKSTIDFVQILACHLGYRTIIRKYWSKNPTYPLKGTFIYTLQLTKTTVFTVDVAKKFKKVFHKRKFEGTVWCPTTKYDTWIARRNDKVFITGNCKQFPAFATRYIYDNPEDGEYGQFKIDVMREPRDGRKTYSIPCRYDYNTKVLSPVNIITGKSEETDKKSKAEESSPANIEETI